MNRIPSFSLFAVLICIATAGSAHEPTLTRFLQRLATTQLQNSSEAETVDRDPARSCQLSLNLVDDWSREPTPALVRITNLESGKPVALADEIDRGEHWYALPGRPTVRVPRARLRIEALRGLATRLVSKTIDVSKKASAAAAAELSIKEFYETGMRGIYGGNTHLHLMKLTHAEADRYLRLVPRADDLDLVFLSHLRRLPDERHYISNQIVENSFEGGDLARLSEEGVLFGNGQEHRHNFGGFGEGYGHVMLLNLRKLIRPVSLGPGIMKTGTDGRPLQTGVVAARNDAATIIWCHNTFGHEDIPNWLTGHVDAQNIFDGGDHGSYADTFYRYLNIGLHVPFSTGTDWFIYDFSRVYVPVDGELTVPKWLDALREGKSYITNGPFLELETERAAIGGTLRMTGPNRVTVVGRGMGRQNFRGLELVYNGKVVHRTRAKAADGYYVADLRHGLEVDKPGWFALRVPLENGKTELGRPLFAHTSPIYVRMADETIFDVPTATALLAEMKSSSEFVQEKGIFADADERDSVASVYRKGIRDLEAKIAEAKKRQPRPQPAGERQPRPEN